MISFPNAFRFIVGVVLIAGLCFGPAVLAQDKPLESRDAADVPPAPPPIGASEEQVQPEPVVVTSPEEVLASLPGPLAEPERPYAIYALSFENVSSDVREIVRRISQETLEDSIGTMYGWVPYPHFEYLDIAGIEYEILEADWNELTSGFIDYSPSEPTDLSMTPEPTLELAVFPDTCMVDTVWGNQYWYISGSNTSCGSAGVDLCPPSLQTSWAHWDAWVDRSCLDNLTATPTLKIRLDESVWCAPDPQVCVYNFNTGTWGGWFYVARSGTVNVNLSMDHFSAGGTVRFGVGTAANWLCTSHLCVYYSYVTLCYKKLMSTVTFNSNVQFTVLESGSPVPGVVWTDMGTYQRGVLDSISQGYHAYTLTKTCYENGYYSLNGCNLALNPTINLAEQTGYVLFEPVQDNCEVWEGLAANNYLGNTPITITGLDLNIPHYFTIKKSGYRDYEDYHVQWTCPPAGTWADTFNLSLTPCYVSVSGKVLTPMPDLLPVSSATVYAISGTDTLGAAVTNDTGYYKITGVPVPRTPITLVPQRGTDLFDPSFLILDLLCDQNEVGINFKDTSGFFVSGYVKHDICDSAPVRGVEMWGLSSSYEIFTDEDGYYLLLLPGGVHTINAEKEGHGFLNDPREIEVTGPMSNVNFTDTTSCEVSGYCTDACGNPIEGITVELASFACTTQFSPTGADGYYALEVPPEVYRMSAWKPMDPTWVFPMVDSVLIDTDYEHDFIHMAPLKLRCDTPDPPCGALAKKQQWVYQFTVVDELNCPVTGATLEIENQASDTTGSGVVYDTIPMGDSSSCNFVVTGGYPSLYPKTITVNAVKEGYTPGDSSSWTTDLIITGKRFKDTTFVTKLDTTTPFLILYDPPGDGSYSFWSESETFSNEMGMTLEKTGGYDLEFHAGVDNEYATALVTGTSSFSTTEVVGDRIGYEVTTSSEYQTNSDENEHLIGPGQGTTYLTAGWNMIYGEADQIAVDESCVPYETEVLAWDLDTNQSDVHMIMFTAWHIQNILLEDDPLILSDSDRVLYERLLDLDITRDNAIEGGEWDRALAYDENKTFYGGTWQQHDSATTVDTVTTFETRVVFDSSLAFKYGLNYYVSVGGEFVVKTTVTYGSYNVEGYQKANRVGYVLTDNDDLDKFYSQIWLDRAFGVPFFINGAGSGSMCPWEKHTSPNEGIVLVNRSGTNQASVCPGDAANFVFELDFTGLLEGGSEFDILAPVGELNPCGAWVKFNGDLNEINNMHVDDSSEFLVNVAIKPINCDCPFPQQVTIRVQSSCDPQIYSDQVLTVNCDMSKCGQDVILVSPFDGARVRDTVLVKAKPSIPPSSGGVRFYIREKFATTPTELCYVTSAGGDGVYTCNWDSYLWTSDKEYYLIAVTVEGSSEVGNPDSVRVYLDNSCPSVLTTIPGTGGSYAGTISVEFTEEIDPTTPDCLSMRLFDVTDGVYIGCSQVMCDDRIAQFLPAYALPEGHDYTATVTNDVRDLTGNRLCSDYTWNFVEGACCVAKTGNIDGDPGDMCDIGDLTRLIDYLFISYQPIGCPEEADCDGIPGVDIGDLTELIGYLFIPPFEEPASCP